MRISVASLSGANAGIVAHKETEQIRGDGVGHTGQMSVFRRRGVFAGLFLLLCGTSCRTYARHAVCFLALVVCHRDHRGAPVD